jgi:hypothetical protein
MCNFIPVRNWLITLGILAGFAGTSAVFAMLWQKNGGFPLVTTISYSAAATWAAGALTAWYFTTSALTTFCTCAGRVSACAAACASLRIFLTILMIDLYALCGLCAVEAGDWAGLEWYLWPPIILAASAALMVTGMVGFYGNALRTCGAP